MRIFDKKQFDIKGRVLSKADFKLAREVAEYKIDESRMEKVIERAEKALTSPIPMLTLSMYRNYLEEGSTVVYGSPYRERMEMAMNLFLAEYFPLSVTYSARNRFIAISILSR